MSDEEEVFNEDVEFQNTQREIEELRKKEEELMSKMTELAKKRKSASDNSLDDNEEDEHENIGRRRRPSLSRGSSPAKPQKRPDSLKLSHESGTFRSRGSSSSSTSPTKESRIRSISPSKKGQSGSSSKSSSRSSSISPTKVQARSSISVTSSRSSSSSPIKQESIRPGDQGYKISIRSPRKETASSGARSPTKSSQLQKTSPKKVKSDRRMNRSLSTPSADVKELKEKKGRRRSGSGEFENSKQASYGKNQATSAENIARDKLVNLDDDKNTEEDNKAFSTGNLANTEVPENEIVKRGPRGSRSSIESGKSRNSMNINEDSYEIIEIDDDIQKAPSNENVHNSSSPRRGKDTLTARQKIEYELAEQVKREEEMRRIHMGGKEHDEEKVREDEEEEIKDFDDVDDEELVIEQDEEEYEQNDAKVRSLTAKEKIEKELAEQKLREEELRLSHASVVKEVDADEEYMKEEDELIGNEEEDEIEDQVEEESDEDTGNTGNQLSTWEKIALEIEEEKKREEERKINLQEDSSNDDEEAGVRDTRIKVHLEIEGMINDKEELDEDSGEESEEEPSRVMSVQDKIEREIKEIEERERELKKTQLIEDEEDNEKDEGIEDSETMEVESAAKGKIQQEIEEFKRKETELRKCYGVEDDENDSDDDDEGEQKKDTMSMIELEMAEQRRKETEYKNQHIKELIDSQKDEDKGEDLGDDQSSLKDQVSDEDEASSICEDDKEEVESKKEEATVSQGITRKYIQMFNTEGDTISKKQRQEKSDDDNKLISKGITEDDESVTKDEDVVSGEDDVDEDGDLGNSIDDVRDIKEIQGNDERNVTKTQAVSPGKKLVLKRKKSKKSDDNKQKENEVISKVTVAGTRKSFEKKKETKPVKKAHPLAMHWEKLQEQHQSEAIKNDREVIRKKQEAEKRKKREQEERQQNEKSKQMLEIKELQERRRSLAEAWENKNNNEENVKVGKKPEKTTKIKNVSGKISPRKSPGKKKEINPRTKLNAKEELPKSARANIKLWEERIASSNQ